MRATAAKPTEAGFTRTVIELAKLRGWRVAHFRPARTAHGWRTAMSGDVGWPDLFLARACVVIVAELKVGKNPTSAEQDAWIAALRAAGIRCEVWYPADWPKIEEALT